jgi:short-subunit dehydrogenase
VLALSEGLHEEVRGTGVTVTALCPGPTATEFTVRADMEQSKLFERSMSAEAVARLGLAGFEAGRAVVVTGAANRLGAIGVRFLPRAWVRWGAGKLQGDRS